MFRRGGAFLFISLFILACAPINYPSPEVVHFGVPYDPDSLDPHGFDTLSSIAISSHFYEGLVKVDGSLRILPGIAVRWETPDATLWRFHLRPNVRFHSGKPLAAADVVYSFQRVMNNSALEISIYARNISEVRAVNDRIVELKTKKPSSILLNKIRLISIIPAGSKDRDLENSVDGTGPYKLESWSKGNYVKMIRNDQYWGPVASVEHAEFHLRLSPDQARQQLRRGKMQLVQCNSKKLETELPSQFQMIRGDSLFVRYIGFDLSKSGDTTSPFRNLQFREAIHKSLNRKALVADLSSYAVTATQPVPVFVFGYNPSITLVETNESRCAEFVRKRGWLDKKRVTMHVRHVYEETARLVVEQLESCGVSIEVHALPDLEFFELRQKKQVQSYIGRYGCTTADASDLVEDLFYSQDHEGTNPTRYMHPPLKGEPSERMMVDTIEHRRQGLQTLMSMFMKDLLVIPLYVEQDSFAVHKSYTWQPRYDSLVLASEVTRVDH